MICQLVDQLDDSFNGIFKTKLSVDEKILIIKW